MSLHKLVILRAIFILGYSVFFMKAKAQITYDTSIRLNYTRSWDATAPETDPAVLITRPLKDVKQITAFVDGLGRPIQTVRKQGGTATGKAPVDMVSLFEYDRYGREQYQFLSFAANTTGGNTSIDDGRFKRNPYHQQAAFGTLQYPGETYYYSKTSYEASPLNRADTSFAPGDNWVGSNRGVTIHNWANTATDSIRLWTVTDVSNDWGTYSTSVNYPAGTLYKTSKTNEQGNQIIEYKDKDNKIIVKKVQLTAPSDTGTGSGYAGWLATYYVYDAWNNLRLVIQPKGVQLLLDNSWDLTALGGAILDEQCFRYEYDTRNRAIRKKMPGVAEVCTIYDKWNRPVLMQDANLRSQNKWIFTKYDALNRAIITGFYTDNTYTTESTMQAHLDGLNVARYETYDPASNPVYSLTNSFPSVSSPDVLSFTFYDDYAWSSWYGSYSTKDNSYDSYFPSANNSTWPYPQPITMSTTTVGKVTGVWENNGKLIANYYDDYGRIIQTKTYQPETGGVDINTTQYNFSGQPLQMVLRHQKTGTNAQTHLVVTRLSYDDVGRVLKIDKKLDSTAVHTIVSNEYDVMGQLLNKTYDNNIENTRYDYNIRGWLTGLNKGYVAGDSTNYFGMELGYDKMTSAAGTTSYSNAQYAGNVTGMIWRGSMNSKYDYSYDAANRLIGAAYLQNTNGSTWDNTYADYTVHNLTYDANGNMMTRWQKSWLLGGPAQVDALTYYYYNYGNKLKGILDNRNDEYSTIGDFHYSLYYSVEFGGIKPSGSVDYVYDDNGNMTVDKNKDIGNLTSDGIEYNFQNLPILVHFYEYYTQRGTIAYTYDLSGNKLKKVITETGKPTKTTLYVNGFVYQNDTLQYILHEEGRIRYGKKYFLNGDSTNQFTYDYFVKDHIGNVRMVLTEQKDTADYFASMETASRGKEDSLFTNISSTEFPTAFVPGGYPTDPTTTPNDYVSKTNGSNNKTGPALVLKVMIGDTVNIAVKSFYQSGGTPNDNNSPVNDIIASLATGIIGAVGETKGIYSQLNNTFNGPILGAVNAFRTDNNPNQPTKPKAYLNWVLLDEQFNYVTESSSAIPVGAADDIRTLAASGIRMARSGFLYIYTTNETKNWDVYFDNLSIRHITGPVTQETNYYPFGTIMNGLTSKSFNTTNPSRYAFMGKELQTGELSDGGSLEQYDFGARSYDPQIARWLSADPKAELMRRFSPYNFAFDNPLRFMDADGMAPYDIVYLDENGREIRRRVDPNINKVMVIKTTKTASDIYTKAERSSMVEIDGKKVPEAADVKSISGKEARQTKKAIENEDFDNPVVKANTVEIVSIDVLQKMRSNIKDNGERGTDPMNNKEYGGSENAKGVLSANEGPVSNPQTGGASVTIPPGKNAYHSHPSGTVGDDPPTPADENAAQASTGSTTTLGSSSSVRGYFMQGTSRKDQNRAIGVEYTFGMRDKSIYIFNSTGIVATLPMSVSEPKNQ